MSKYGSVRAIINLDNAESNFKNLKALISSKTKICCVLKANAYGHGAVTMARLYEKEGADYFAVATPLEALELRKNGITVPIMTLGYTGEKFYDDFIENDVDFTVFSYHDAKEISDAALRKNKNANIHIAIDTGMSRIGFQADEESINEIRKISSLKNLHFKGIFTHFARSDEKERETTVLQYKLFIEMISELEDLGITFDIRHCDNSAGMLCYPEYGFDMVRLGIVLYGYFPSDEVDRTLVSLKPVMTLKTDVTHVKALPAGRSVSYGFHYTLEEPQKIATCAIGYADGLLREFKDKVEFCINGKFYKIVGNICMDQCMLRVDDNVKKSDEVVIFGDILNCTAADFARKVGTISYEILCLVGHRVRRVYLRNGKIECEKSYL